MFRGNKTHNAVCVLGPVPAEPHGQLTILLLAMATCILVLTTAQLSLHIWQLRRKHMWPQGQLGPREGERVEGPSCLLTMTSLQRPSHFWRCSHHQQRTPAAASSLRRSGGSGWGRTSWGLRGCEADHPPEQLHPSQTCPRSLPRLTLGGQGSAFHLCWARPCSPQRWKWV